MTTRTIRGHDGERLATQLGDTKELTELVIDAQPERITITSNADRSIDSAVDPWSEPLEALREARPPGLVRVSFGASPPVAGSAYARMPSVREISEALPGLEELAICGSSRWGGGWGDGPDDERLVLAALRRLELRFAWGESDGVIAVLRGARLPRLERLSIWLGGLSWTNLDVEVDEDEDVHEDDEPGETYVYQRRDIAPEALDDLEIENVSATEADDLLPILEADLPATITELGLQSGVLGEAAIEAIAGAPRLATLARLDLSGGVLDAGAVAALVEAQPRLRHLTAIDLRQTCWPDEASARRVKAALPAALVGEPRDGAQPIFFLRYVGAAGV